MDVRPVILAVAAALAVLPPQALGQTPRQAGSLTPFRSARELSSYLAGLPTTPRRAPVPPSPHEEPPCGGAWVRAPAAAAATHGGRPAIVRGRVIDPSGVPIPGAVVLEEASQRTAATTAAGEYRLELPDSAAGDSVLVRVMAPHFQWDRRWVPVRAGDSTKVDVELCMANSEAVSVTNNQVGGVGGGDIVKVHGDHLVMLRRGRLFTISTAGGRLTPVSAVNAFGSDLVPYDWYGKVLVFGNNVVVIGYSHMRGGTELGFFRIDRQGRLTYRDTYHLRADNFHSLLNDGSRLTGTRLVLYTSPGIVLGDDPSDWMPAMRRWHRGATDAEFQPISSPTRIYRPGRALGANDRIVLHTVTTCELARPEVSCSAMGVLAPEDMKLYVSETAAYVWVSNWVIPSGRSRAASMLYRLPLDGTSPSALGVEGNPVNHFSFMESGDGFLNVLVRSGAAGARMGSAERTPGDVALLRVPLTRFADGRTSASARRYRALPGGDGGVSGNRFVGRYLLYSTGNGWGHPHTATGSRVFTTRIAGGPVASLALPHTVDLIEAMGSDAVVVGTDGHDLHVSAIGLDAGRPRLAQRYVDRGVGQGWLRSHGLFYRADGPDAGVLGLPVRDAGRPGFEHLSDGSAAVVFLRNRSGRFEALGELEARPPASDKDESDDCVASCLDWYGNSHPIFFRGRIFALLGYELVEGAVARGRLREVGRVNYTPSPRVSAR